jgi:tRNA (cmo5U34)-methyltransferase
VPGSSAGSPPADPPTGKEASYDRLVQQLIPGYASLARLGVALLAASPLASAEGAPVLVAGCGTGAELLEARAQRPDWRLTALDPSPAMLAVARARLAQAPGIDWRCARLEEIGARSCFDGALAVLVLQALPDDGSKLTFLSELAAALRPGAQVVLVDLMRPERSPLEAQIARAREGFQRASGASPDAGGSRDRLDGLTRGLHPIGLARLTALLDAAGFGDPAPVFQALDFEGFLLQRRA